MRNAWKLGCAKSRINNSHGEFNCWRIKRLAKSHWEPKDDQEETPASHKTDSTTRHFFWCEMYSSWLTWLLLGLLWSRRLPGARCSTNVGRSSNHVAPNNEDTVLIEKCCGREELLVDDNCTPISETNEMNETRLWQPEFVDGTRKIRKERINYELQVGRPICRSDEHESHVYYYPNGGDRLAILTSGKLRHFIPEKARDFAEQPDTGMFESYDEDDPDYLQTIHYDYPFGHYCIDKAVLSGERLVATYAMLCVPVLTTSWTDTSYFMGHLVDPIFRAFTILSYLIVAIVYFVLPQLRDLVGNMITSMSLCLLTSQSAATVRIFTEYGNHISFLVADTVAYVSLLAAFFWLNAIGYYVWTTFRSRNVFLRVTDGRKYCYYSSYVWGSTVTISAMAIFAHFALETNKPMITTGMAHPPQETVGWLGLSVIFATIAFTIIVDLCFVLTTSNTIKRMSTYGRLHHKMKYSFRMFALLFGIMSTGWLALLLSQLKFEVLVYSHIILNFLQAILVLYVCIFGQKRVTFLLGKTCNCCHNNESPEGLDWGEEMTAINAGY